MSRSLDVRENLDLRQAWRDTRICDAMVSNERVPDPSASMSMPSVLKEPSLYRWRLTGSQPGVLRVTPSEVEAFDLGSVYFNTKEETEG
jgi:hypothetical protein